MARGMQCRQQSHQNITIWYCCHTWWSDDDDSGKMATDGTDRVLSSADRVMTENTTTTDERKNGFNKYTDHVPGYLDCHIVSNALVYQMSMASWDWRRLCSLFSQHQQEQTTIFFCLFRNRAHFASVPRFFATMATLVVDVIFVLKLSSRSSLDSCLFYIKMAAWCYRRRSAGWFSIIGYTWMSFFL